MALLNTQEAAKILTIKPETLEVWRWRGEGPLFIKVGKCVRYRPEDIEAYLKSKTRKSTTKES